MAKPLYWFGRKGSQQMNYFLAQFLGYKIVVATTSNNRAMDRLVEYVRVTKGNVGYEEEQIRKEGKIYAVDMVDDIGYLSGLQQVTDNLLSLKKETNEKIQKELEQVEKLKRKIRNLMEEVGFDSDYDWME